MFLWWSAIWSVMFRGYGLAAPIYYVVEADLEPLQLVLLGTALEVSVLLAEIPTEFVPLLLTQVMWGIGWPFTSGADVAWITDELDDAERIDRVLAARLTLNSGAEAVDERARSRATHRHTLSR